MERRKGEGGLANYIQRVFHKVLTQGVGGDWWEITTCNAGKFHENQETTFIDYKNEYLY